LTGVYQFYREDGVTFDLSALSQSSDVQSPGFIWAHPKS